MIQNKSNSLFIVFLFLTTWSVIAQSIIEIQGKVSDFETQESLTSATVVFSPTDKPSILGFGITDKNGAYQVKFNPKNDSLRLKVSYLGYKTFEKTIPAISQEIDISLEAATESLEEVFLRRPPITQRGDTLI